MSDNKHIGVCVLGAAESGIGAALLAHKEGYDVFVTDYGKIEEKAKKKLEELNIPYEEERHSEEKILKADIVIKSPGIADTVSIIKKIKEKGIEIISEIEWAYRFKGDSKVVAITGTNGKTTTTSLVYHICKTAGLECALVGNIGNSFAAEVADNPKPLYIAEISSFQLDDITTFKPDIAVLLNITEDHLDRYDHKMEKYIDSKFKIIENQTAKDVFIYNADDEIIIKKIKNSKLLSQSIPFTMKHEENKGAYIKNGQMMMKIQEERVSMDIYDFALKGKHNQYNTMAAGLAGASLNIRKEKIREAIKTFENLEHRMEFVKNVNGVDYINDSKGTNLNSVWFALESMTKPTVLIMGGVDKGNDYSFLEELVKEKVKAIVCIGLDNSKILHAFGAMLPMVDTDNMKDAVTKAQQMSKEGDTVLLSPGCSSFDLFKNYMERGNIFKVEVNLL